MFFWLVFPLLFETRLCLLLFFHVFLLTPICLLLSRRRAPNKGHDYESLGNNLRESTAVPIPGANAEFLATIGVRYHKHIMLMDILFMSYLGLPDTPFSM